MHYIRYLLKGRSIRQHFIADACQRRNVTWNGLAWIDQALEMFCYLKPIMHIYGDLGDAVG